MAGPSPPPSVLSAVPTLTIFNSVHNPQPGLVPSISDISTFVCPCIELFLNDAYFTDCISHVTASAMRVGLAVGQEHRPRSGCLSGKGFLATLGMTNSFQSCFHILGHRMRAGASVFSSGSVEEMKGRTGLQLQIWQAVVMLCRDSAGCRTLLSSMLFIAVLSNVTGRERTHRKHIGP